MLLMTSLHVHDTAAAGTECIDCVHNSCHGHLTQLASWSHDCVLCQFLTLTFVTAAVASLMVVCQVANSLTHPLRCPVYKSHSGIVGLRAPPAFSI